MIPYLGNKSNNSDLIRQFLPKNPKKWIEPFGGSFGLYFTLDFRDYPDTNFFYNDINPLNCNLFEDLKDKKFVDLVNSTKVNKALFEKSYLDIIDQPDYNKKGKKVLKVSKSHTKSLSWLVILCCGDSQNLMSKEYKGNFAFEIFKNKLPRYSEYFNKINVSNLNYKDVLKEHDSEDSFFFIDPPYVGFEDFWVKSNFGNDSHSELSEELKNLKGKWLLSYYNFDKLEEWYKDYKIVSQKNNLSEEFLVINSN